MGRAILVDLDGTRHEMEIENAETVGVVLRQNTTLPVSMRAFRYRSSSRVATVPIFEEVKCTILDWLPGER